MCVNIIRKKDKYDKALVKLTYLFQNKIEEEERDEIELLILVTEDYQDKRINEVMNRWFSFTKDFLEYKTLKIKEDLYLVSVYNTITCNQTFSIVQHAGLIEVIFQ
jgi:antitoxin component HigA of HigAB toxin-antitoxin module